MSKQVKRNGARAWHLSQHQSLGAVTHDESVLTI